MTPVAADKWVLAKPDALIEQIPLGLKASWTICLDIKTVKGVAWAHLAVGNGRKWVGADLLLPDPEHEGYPPEGSNQGNRI